MGVPQGWVYQRGWVYNRSWRTAWCCVNACECVCVLISNMMTQCDIHSTPKHSSYHLFSLMVCRWRGWMGWCFRPHPRLWMWMLRLDAAHQPASHQLTTHQPASFLRAAAAFFLRRFFCDLDNPPCCKAVNMPNIPLDLCITKKARGILQPVVIPRHFLRGLQERPLQAPQRY